MGTITSRRWAISNPYGGIDWPSIHRVKTALHNHTINTNAQVGEHSDTVFDTPAERIAAYRRLGFGAVAITEHDSVSYPWSDYGITDTDVISIPGNELSKHSHMLSYFNTYYDRRGEGPSCTDGIIANIRSVEELGGFLYAAHPNRDRHTSQPEYLLKLLDFPQIVGLEVLFQLHRKSNLLRWITFGVRSGSMRRGMVTNAGSNGSPHMVSW